MDLRRFADLFAAEAGEHVRLLNEAILGLESSDPPASLEAAFRSAHTIKGLAATMGFRRVTTLSHTLEDLLDELRAGRRTLARDVVDDLLRRVDELEAAVGAACAGETQPESAAPVTGAARLARVRLRRDTPLRAARAMLIVRAAERTGIYAAHEPATFDDDFAGDLLIHLVAGADESAAEAAIRSAGDVAEVVFEHEALEVEPVAAAPAADVPLAEQTSHHVRVARRRLDDVAEGIGELSVLHARLQPASNGRSDPALDRMGSVLSELQRAIMEMRMVPLSAVFDRFPRLVRDAARALGKEIEFEIEGGEVEVDRSVADEVRDPLVHLLRNAVDHGLEAPEVRVRAGKAQRGRLLLRVTRERGSVRIDVADDGRGIDAARVAAKARGAGGLREGGAVTQDELFRLISAPGFTTAERVSEVSGRGVGLDAVVNRLRALGGALNMSTAPGVGTTFTLRLPITLALAQALRVRVGGEDYAIPLTHVREAVELVDVMLVGVAGRESMRLREELLPLIRLRQVLDVAVPGEEHAAVVAEAGDRRAALAVDELVGREQILIKSFVAPAGTLPVFSGVTLLADGQPALILDPLSVL